MEVFNFDYHSVRKEYPITGYNVKLGGSYSASVAPTTKPQFELILDFKQMRRFMNDNKTEDLTTSPEINFNRLVRFYEEHELWKTFLYDHPIDGRLRVRFKDPLKEPKTRLGGYVDDVTVKFEVQP